MRAKLTYAHTRTQTHVHTQANRFRGEEAPERDKCMTMRWNAACACVWVLHWKIDREIKISITKFRYGRAVLVTAHTNLTQNPKWLAKLTEQHHVIKKVIRTNNSFMHVCIQRVIGVHFNESQLLVVFTRKQKDLPNKLNIHSLKAAAAATPIHHLFLSITGSNSLSWIWHLHSHMKLSTQFFIHALIKKHLICEWVCVYACDYSYTRAYLNKHSTVFEIVFYYSFMYFRWLDFINAVWGLRIRNHVLFEDNAVLHYSVVVCV